MTKKLFSIAAFFAAISIGAQENTVPENGSITIDKATMPDLITDENLTVAKLPNGLTIVIYPNAEPPKRVSMRLLVRRGSSTEGVGEEGLAHFIEHMAFNGTVNFPKGDMIEYFQRLGMAFGADTNAHTGFNETVYKIDMPSNDLKLIRDGIVLLNDYASGILFNPEEIERERGVIIAEKKSRDTAAYRASIDLIKTIFPDSVYAKRFPIGEESTILNAPRSSFVNFYKVNYRPENMVLVVVGDVKPSLIIEAAKKQFAPLRGDSDIRASSADVAPFAAVTSEPVRAYHVADADMRDSSAGIYIVSAQKFPEDSAEKRVYNMRLSAIAKILSLRFDARKSAKDSEFSSAYADFGNFEDYADIFSIGARSTVGNCDGALEEVVKMYMGALANGFGEWELGKAKAEIINSIESEILGKSTRQSAALANGIVSALSSREVVTSPETDLAFAKYAFEGFDAEAASKMFRELLSSAQVFAQTRDIPSEKAASDARFVLEKFLSGGGEIALSTPLDNTELKFADFGKAGELASDTVDDLGIRRLVFKNGVRANLKRTDFAKDEISINISFGGGRLDLPKEKPGLASIASGFILGGTENQTFDEINVAKSDKNIFFNFSAEGDAFTFAGSSTPKYFHDALALMATYIKTPAFRKEASAALKKMIDAHYRQMETNPEMSLVKIDGWITDGNFRLAFPEKAEVESLTMSDLQQWLEPILKTSYMEISIAGDIDEEEAKKHLLELFASLKPRDNVRKDYSVERKVELTAEPSTIFYVNNVNDARSFAVKIWPTCDRTDIKKMRTANILGAVVNEAVRKIVREASGKVYSPFAYNNSNPTFSYGTIAAVSDVTPEFNAEVLELLEKSVESVTKNISEDEFDRAKAPILKQVEKTRRMNSYWANSVMPMLQSDPIKYEIAKTFEKGYEEITLADVKSAAAEFLGGKAGYSVKILPAKSE